MLKCRLCNVLVSQDDADAASEIVGAGHETMCVPCAESIAIKQPCECGDITGEPCECQREVIVEWMPITLRSSHIAAGNSGNWPDNGAWRLEVSKACAERLVNDDPDWCSVIE